MTEWPQAHLSDATAIAPQRKPLLILVGGPGGAGKSTLARTLGDQLQLVHVSRDTVKAAIALSEAKLSQDGRLQYNADRSAMGGTYGQRAFVAAYDAVAVLLRAGASVIMDQAWRTGLSEEQLQPLVDLARAVQVHATTSPEVALERTRARGHRDGLAGTAEAERALLTEWEAFGPLELGIPTLIVDTTSEYTPSLASVTTWIWENTANA